VVGISSRRQLPGRIFGRNGCYLGLQNVNRLPQRIHRLQRTNHPIRIPIATENKYSAKRVDPRIYTAESVTIRPYSEVWVPVKFSPIDNAADLFVTPVRHANIAEGTYATCSYAIMAHDTSHLVMVNPSPRPVKIAKGESVGMFEPLPPNTPCCFYGAAASTALNPTTITTNVFSTTTAPA
jgi:hypothetical protein